jgi:hypothetical protein
MCPLFANAAQPLLAFGTTKNPTIANGFATPGMQPYENFWSRTGARASA